MYILVAHVFPLGAVETRSGRQRSRRRQIRGAGRGPGLQVAGLYPCRRGMLGPGFRLARALCCRSRGWKGSFWAGAAWEDAARQRGRCGRPGRTRVVAGQPWLGARALPPRDPWHRGSLCYYLCERCDFCLASSLPESLQGVIPNQLKCCHFLPAESEQLTYFKESKPQQRGFTENSLEGHQKSESDPSPVSRFTPYPLSLAGSQPGSTQAIPIPLHSAVPGGMSPRGGLCARWQRGPQPTELPAEITSQRMNSYPRFRRGN